MIVVGLSVFANITENLGLSLVLPLIKCELNLTIAEESLLNTVCFFGIFLGTHFWGFLADKVGRQKVLQTVLGGCGIFGFLAAFSPSFHIFMALRFVDGLLYVQYNKNQ